ncbi:hypothetical protein [Streptomyces sp. NBC_00525]|uniref:hypothetical protein n=1 Tax=Streptomyces sp. NBC_00525 TaxID=2903660 RepID=UPI002E815D31|nr:hypothetical protein [Streptomyces sp. NBC_00525]WUC96419.1 hypothetical protein OG710_23695 [Streptomyces sp. NBC_00525]
MAGNSGTRGAAGLDRVRFISAHYEVLQGTVVVPALLLFAFVLFAGTPAAPGLDTPVWYGGMVAAGLIATLLAVQANRRFTDAYGEVRPKRRVGQRMILLTVLGTVLVGGLHALDLDTPVSPEGLAVSVVLLGCAVRLGPLALPVGLVGGLGLVAGLLPLGSMLDSGRHPLSVLEYLLALICLAGAAVALWGRLIVRRSLATEE